MRLILSNIPLKRFISKNNNPIFTFNSEKNNNSFKALQKQSVSSEVYTTPLPTAGVLFMLNEL